MSNPFIDSEGHKRWYNSKEELHRVDGPAIEYIYGSKEWFVDGKRHRLDGPAYEGVNGSKGWYVDGKEVTKSDYPAAVLMFKCKRVLES